MGNMGETWPDAVRIRVSLDSPCTADATLQVLWYRGRSGYPSSVFVALLHSSSQTRNCKDADIHVPYTCVFVWTCLIGDGELKVEAR